MKDLDWDGAAEAAAHAADSADDAGASDATALHLPPAEEGAPSGAALPDEALSAWFDSTAAAAGEAAQAAVGAAQAMVGAAQAEAGPSPAAEAGPEQPDQAPGSAERWLDALSPKQLQAARDATTLAQVCV